MKKHIARETWLQSLTAILAEAFDAAGSPLPKKLRVSVGWPTRRAASLKNKVIGQCFDPKMSADKHTEVFISPAIGDGTEAGAILVHELVHAAAGCEHGHKKPFVDLARKMGLEGKPTATTAGKELVGRLNGMVKKLGPYPHATISLTTIPKQSTRLIKIECPGCGYICRTTLKWSERGLPICHCGEPFELT